MDEKWKTVRKLKDHLEARKLLLEYLDDCNDGFREKAQQALNSVEEYIREIIDD